MKKPAAKAKPAPKAKQPAGGKPAHKGAVVTSKTTAKAKAAKPAPKKAAKPAKVSAKVKAARHASALKAAKTRAVNAKKARQLSLGSAVACCSAEALAASLRLSGWPVSDADVLALYLRTTRDLDAGAPILATLEAAAEYGLAGMRPLTWECVNPAISITGIFTPLTILGLALPAPHAVLDTGSEWITWGEAWPAWAFPGIVIEEAWLVDWGHVLPVVGGPHGEPAEHETGGQARQQDDHG